MLRNVLIKISGDLVDHPDAIDFIRKQSQTAFTVVLVGGGTEITEALEKEGYKSHFTGVGRVISDFEGRQLARNILERNQQRVQDKLLELGINAVVEVPVINLGCVLCHLNGDNLASACSVNFDSTYVLTLAGRKKTLKGHNLKVIEID